MNEKMLQELMLFQKSNSRVNKLLDLFEDFLKEFPELHCDVAENKEILNKYTSLGEALNEVIQCEAKVVSGEEVDSKDNLSKLEGLCKPIMKELKDNFHPHISVVITSDGIRVEESIFGVPSKFWNNGTSS